MTKASLCMKALPWGFAYSFRGVAHDHHGRKHGGMRSAGTVAAFWCAGWGGVAWTFETSKLNRSDIPPSQGHTP